MGKIEEESVSGSSLDVVVNGVGVESVCPYIFDLVDNLRASLDHPEVSGKCRSRESEGDNEKEGISSGRGLYPTAYRSVATSYLLSTNREGEIAIGAMLSVTPGSSVTVEFSSLTLVLPPDRLMWYL